MTPELQGCSKDDSGHTICPRFIVVGDNFVGHSEPNIDQNDDRLQYVAWRSNSTFPYASFRLTSVTLVTAIDLYFLNYPIQNISLPNLQLYRTSDPRSTTISDDNAEEVMFYILNNEWLSENDYTTRRVTLHPLLPSRSLIFLLRWTFTDLYHVNWFLLSEARFCGDVQPNYSPNVVIFKRPATENAIYIPSSRDLINRVVTLTCTVTLQGSYKWRWRYKDAIILRNSSEFSIFSADGTRSSKLVINEFNTSSPLMFMCEAIHMYGHPTAYRNRTYTIDFQGTNHKNSYQFTANVKP